MGNSKPAVGIVGATGMVGQELLAVLDRRRFPIGKLLPFSSGRTRQLIRFRGRSLAASAPSRQSLASCDLIFFVSSDEVSKRMAPALAGRGCWIIDDSAAFRLDPAVPLVIPEVNAHALSRDRRLIAGPNCTMAPVAVAAAAWHRAAGLREVRLASYQAVSGAGRAALAEFARQSRGGVPNWRGRAPVPRPGAAKALPRQIHLNVIPQVGRIDAAGDSSEEVKVAAELRKVLNAPRLAVSVTAVRVPTARGHALAGWFTLGKALPLSRARRLLAGAPGLALAPEGDYPTPLSAGGRDGVFAGRLRRGATERELCLWIVGDNLLKGAALNSAQIAEELLRRGWL